MNPTQTAHLKSLLPIKVYLVGAGCGDPELITQKGAKLLQLADVVLYDHLAHPALLSLCAPGTKLINVGKQKGQHSARQSRINQLMKRYYTAGNHVVRLKGGDPGVFGRGGEEMAFLKQNHIPYEVIPGVTSAVAVPEYQGIPLTYRDMSRSFAVVTGTLHRGKSVQSIELPQADTLVFLMGVSHLSEIIQALLQTPRYTAKTPIAVIANGTYAAEAMRVGTLGDIEKRLQKQPLPYPALLVVGEVVRAARDLNWRDQLPLSSARIIMTRPHSETPSLLEQAARFLGAEWINAPAIALKPLETCAQKLTRSRIQKADTILWTSANAVKFSLKALLKNGLDSRIFAGKTLITVGPKTAEALKEWGLTADLQPEKFNQEGLVHLIRSHRHIRSILWPASADARPLLKTELIKQGIKIDPIPLYKTIPASPNPALSLQPGDNIILTSPSAVPAFLNAYPIQTLPTVTWFAAGKQTEKALQEKGRTPVWTSPAPESETLLPLLISRHTSAV